MAMQIVRTIKEIEKSAREEELDGNLEEAAGLYEQVLKQQPLNERSYDRLMILYRKLKRTKDELRIINAGIKFFQEYYKKKLKKLRVNKRQITLLSNAFMKSTGLKDKKGNEVYYPEPVGKFIKRKQVVEQKLKKEK